MRIKSKELVLSLVFISLSFVCSESWAGGEPYFRTCNVMAFNTPDGISTLVYAQVYDPNGTVPASISSLTVNGPGGAFVYSFSESNDYEGYNQYWHSLPGLPTDGEYTFAATDSEGKSATSHFYLKVGSTISLPDSSTLLASGDPSAPTLSWGAVSTYEGDLFYRARIYDMSDNILWTSGFTAYTSVYVPPGVLSGKSYKWRVEAFDDNNFFTAYNRAVSETVALTADNNTPFFVYATVFKRVDSSGTWTALEAQVIDPNGKLPSTISSIRVTGPGGFDQTLDSSYYDPQFVEYYRLISGSPTPGIYQFTVTDSEGKTATSYDYLADSSIPIVDPGTLQASGDPLAPRLSWGAPYHADQSLYFRARIYPVNSGNLVYGTSRSPDTALQVPYGYLQKGVSYEWHVRAEDSSYFVHVNAHFRTDKIALNIDNTHPSFDYATIYYRFQPDGTFTMMDVQVSDPNGSVPSSIDSLSVTGPGGFSYVFQPADYDPVWNSYVHRIPGKTEPGVYTFTVTDTEANTAVTHDYLGASADIPSFDENTIGVNGPTLVPTVSWGGISGYEGRVYYRLVVADPRDHNLWAYWSSRQFYTMQTVAGGSLEPGKSYDCRIEAYDDSSWIIYNNRRNSNWFPCVKNISMMPGIPLLLLED